jgi:hypothetical protein
MVPMMTVTCWALIKPASRAPAATGSSGANRSPVTVIRGPNCLACRTRCAASRGDRFNTPANNAAVERITYRPGRLRSSTSAISRCSTASNRRRARSSSRTTPSSSSSANDDNTTPATSSTAADNPTVSTAAEAIPVIPKP